MYTPTLRGEEAAMQKLVYRAQSVEEQSAWTFGYTALIIAVCGMTHQLGIDTRCVSLPRNKEYRFQRLTIQMSTLFALPVCRWN